VRITDSPVRGRGAREQSEGCRKLGQPASCISSAQTEGAAPIGVGPPLPVVAGPGAEGAALVRSGLVRGVAGPCAASGSSGENPPAARARSLLVEQVLHLRPDAPEIWAQVVYARDNEWAETADDVLRRRTTLTIRGLATDDVRGKVQDLLDDK